MAYISQHHDDSKASYNKTNYMDLSRTGWARGTTSTKRTGKSVAVLNANRAPHAKEATEACPAAQKKSNPSSWKKRLPSAEAWLSKGVIDCCNAKYYRGNEDRDVEKAPCVCPLPCRETHYAAAATCTKFRATSFFESIVHDLGADVVTLHFFFPDPVVTTIEQVPIYTVEGLLGSIGGQVGLFMGFSLITVAEMFELIFLLCTRGRHLREERRGNMQHTYGARHAF
ncbi:acid-sensing ion channel 3-like [Haliotis rubra]|uniref:acid-sensing ion channel 3-like n=1 Tax=Haliotis rubra TaxID=36100 RepID=UPI001EE61443|nr:acid-sensing ion channel 3-like [Haliotis rubra]